MYIDPLTLFIVGEILVVYIIINVFLFYKSRLYNVLLALLKEMRFEKLRREQEKQKELAALRASNKGLLDKTEILQASVKSAGKTIPEQLTERIQQLADKFPNAKDLTNSVERDESAQWLRMRMLELEKELLSGNINEERWQELATEAIHRLQETQEAENQAVAKRKEGAEGDRYVGQLEIDLEEAQRLFNDAKIRIRQLEGELDDLKTISTPSQSHLEVPTRGLYEDEIYRLKCDNFDMHEAINKLKLELQQADPSIDSDTYVNLLENQVSNMEQYIKSADIATGLMEKELIAAQKLADDLQAKLSAGSQTAGPVNLSALSSLAEQQEAKSDTLGSIKDTIKRLKNGEASEQIAAEQEAHVARLEQIIKESEQCITILESELSQSGQDIHELKGELAKKKTELLNAKFSGLTEAQQGQKDGVDTMKSIINDLRGGGDTESLLSRQEEEIGKLERFLSESDMIIGQLESEIEELNSKLAAADSAPATPTTSDRPDSSEDMEEMETLLQQFIGDIQGLMRQINGLEDENKKLKEAPVNPTIPAPAASQSEPVQEYKTASDPEPESQSEPATTSEIQSESESEVESEPPIMIDIEPDESDFADDFMSEQTKPSS